MADDALETQLCRLACLALALLLTACADERPRPPVPSRAPDAPRALTPACQDTFAQCLVPCRMPVEVITPPTPEASPCITTCKQQLAACEATRP